MIEMVWKRNKKEFQMVLDCLVNTMKTSGINYEENIDTREQ